ncbi:hypothetical protein H257_02130 [Aphanomyces astaci]|uniref:Uncharacterized protein n=1 Tax=Aphanomyces astaci TaxID=112090 RepID=W4H783_APHAT|nr:hypothetical protein H257_02130 [Aphanomyces astaci]ETV87144.1 hypothetical protein H257_02130 [Aphanomyces astaci]|eukprot:XP_009823943.1 hypothetical protein H257_02130 [Aphanomyces astaci]
MANACHQGHVDVVKLLVQHFGLPVVHFPDVINEAIENDQLSVAEMLHRMGGACAPSDIALEAAESKGCCDVVSYVHENCNMVWTTSVMDNAAIHGHWDLVRFLRDHRIEDSCTTEAIDMAAPMDIWKSCNAYTRLGPKDTPPLRYSWQRTIVIWKSDHAADKGHLVFVQFLHYYSRMDGCMTRAMDVAAMHGHLKVVQFLHHHRDESCTTRALDNAASCTVGAMDKAVSRTRPTRSYSFLARPSTRRVYDHALDDAASRGNLDMVRFLHGHRTEGWTTQAMDAMAARGGHLEIVRFLCETPPDESGSLKAFVETMDAVAGNGHLEMLGCCIWKDKPRALVSD